MRRAAFGAICLLICAVAARGSSALATGGGQTQTFTGAGCTNFTVPAGVTSISATAIGSAGNASGPTAGGDGDSVAGSFSVTPGGKLDVCVDVGGGVAAGSPTGNGGGASGVSAVASDFSAPLLVAGGGGGGGDLGGAGGNAGQTQGAPGQEGIAGASSAGGTGGSQTQVGTGGNGWESGGNGTASSVSGPGSGGTGASNGGTAGGGGGGGGYFGGGGGGAELEGSGGGGGGGSDYCNATLVSSCAVTSGAGSAYGAANNSGSAEVTLSWTAPAAFTTGISSSPSSTFGFLGGSTTDTVTVSGGSTALTPTGTVSFYVCGPAVSSCASTATPVGGAVTLSSSGSATSASYTPSAIGTYCFYATYSGDASFTAASDSAANECFTVMPPASTIPEPKSIAAPIASIREASISPRTGRASFTLTSVGALTKYQCALVKVPAGKHHKTSTLHYGSCAATKVYRHLAAGSYVFYVRAVGPGGTQTPAVTRRFAIS